MNKRKIFRAAFIFLLALIVAFLALNNNADLVPFIYMIF